MIVKLVAGISGKGILQVPQSVQAIACCGVSTLKECKSVVDLTGGDDVTADLVTGITVNENGTNVTYPITATNAKELRKAFNDLIRELGYGYSQSDTRSIRVCYVDGSTTVLDNIAFIGEFYPVSLTVNGTEVEFSKLCGMVIKTKWQSFIVKGTEATATITNEAGETTDVTLSGTAAEIQTALQDALNDGDTVNVSEVGSTKCMINITTNLGVSIVQGGEDVPLNHCGVKRCYVEEADPCDEKNKSLTKRVADLETELASSKEATNVEVKEAQTANKALIAEQNKSKQKAPAKVVKQTTNKAKAKTGKNGKKDGAN